MRRRSKSKQKGPASFVIGEEAIVEDDESFGTGQPGGSDLDKDVEKPRHGSAAPGGGGHEPATSRARSSRPEPLEGSTEPAHMDADDFGEFAREEETRETPADLPINVSRLPGPAARDDDVGDGDRPEPPSHIRGPRILAVVGCVGLLLTLAAVIGGIGGGEGGDRGADWSGRGASIDDRPSSDTRAAGRQAERQAERLAQRRRERLADRRAERRAEEREPRVPEPIPAEEVPAVSPPPVPAPVVPVAPEPSPAPAGANIAGNEFGP